VERAGCLAFLGASVANIIALGAISGTRFWDTLVVLTLFAIATAVRLTQLNRGHVLVLTLHPE
jgi:hypothetical protein